MKTVFLSLSFSIISIIMTNAQDIKFPEPDRKGGMPLMQALNERQSSREFSSRDLPLELMGKLFWAACGSTRGTT